MYQQHGKQLSFYIKINYFFNYTFLQPMNNLTNLMS